VSIADIGRVRSGALSDYQIDMEEVLLPDQVWTGALQDYPRWSASVWDLVARCLAVALTGMEELPQRPSLPQIPIYTSPGTVPVVRLVDIPEPTRTYFEHNLRGSGKPGPDTAFAWDWHDFLIGQR
jgi:hypothetical protein